MNAYMKLYVNLRDAITRGVYDYGTKIPSKRRIADQKGTSIITVEHALAPDRGRLHRAEGKKRMLRDVPRGLFLCRAPSA